MGAFSGSTCHSRAGWFDFHHYVRPGTRVKGEQGLGNRWVREPRGEVWILPGPSNCWDSGYQKLKELQGLQRLPYTFCSFPASFLLLMAWPGLIQQENNSSSPPLTAPRGDFPCRTVALYLVSYHCWATAFSASYFLSGLWIPCEGRNDGSARTHQET